jgi:hypothetical protein
MDTTTILCPRCTGAGLYDEETCYWCKGKKRVPTPDITDEDSQTVLAVCGSLFPALTAELFTDSTIRKMAIECWDFDGTALEHATLDALQCVLLQIPERGLEAFELVGDHPQRNMKEHHKNLFARKKQSSSAGRRTRKLEYVSLASGGYYTTKLF